MDWGSVLATADIASRDIMFPLLKPRGLFRLPAKSPVTRHYWSSLGLSAEDKAQLVALETPELPNVEKMRESLLPPILPIYSLALVSQTTVHGFAVSDQVVDIRDVYPVSVTQSLLSQRSDSTLSKNGRR